MTWAALAAELGVSSRTVQNWRKRDGAPEKADVATWQAFVDKHELGSGGAHSSLEDVKRDRILKQTELDQIKIDQARRLVIPAQEVNDFLATVSTQAKAQLYAAMQTELPPKLEGQDVATIRKHLQEAADAICDKMQSGFDDWAKSHTPEP